MNPSKTTAISNSTKRFPSEAIASLTTPQLLKGGLYLTWVASLLLAIATLSGVQGQRHAIKTVGKDSAPSIISAQRIKDSLADMDANAANELIAKPGENSDAVQSYEERRRKVTQFLVAAAENITFGDAERIPIVTLQVGLGDYIAKIQQARDFHQRGDTAAVVSAYREAAEMMDKTLLPAADALDKANLEVLDRVYAEQKTAAFGHLVFVIFAGLSLAGVLAAIQLFLNRRMRRLLNPALIAATAIAVIFLGYTARALLLASYHLKVAKEDAFTSIHDLRKARAIAYSANGDESRYLLDSAMAATHEQTYYNKVAKLVKLPARQSFEAVAVLSAQGKTVEGFTGYLADELNNITFAGEREAAVETLSTFGTYVKIDQQIRQLQQSGKRAEAIALCVGNNPGQSNWAFDQFKQANQKTLDINLAAFDRAIQEGFQDMDGFEIATPVAVGAIALLTLVGLQPRLKEYSV